MHACDCSGIWAADSEQGGRGPAHACLRGGRCMVRLVNTHGQAWTSVLAAWRVSHLRYLHCGVQQAQDVRRDALPLPPQHQHGALRKGEVLQRRPGAKEEGG